MIAAGSVAPIEIVWTAIAAAGAVFAAYNAYQAGGDYAAARLSGGPVGRFALLVLITESCRVVIQAIFVAIGIEAMLLPHFHPPPGYHNPAHVFTLVFQWGMITAACLLTIQSAVITVERLTVRRAFPPLPPHTP